MSHKKKSKPALNAEDLEGQDSPPPFLEAPLYPSETLLAYEYLEQGSHLWRWELATVEQQVCVRSIDVDMWLRREADGSHHTATDNVIQPRSARPAEDFSEDLFEGTLTRTHALLPLTSPKTEEGQRIKAQLDHKESRIQESMEEVRANVAQLREDKAAMERELAKIEEDRRKAQDELGEAQKGVEMIKAQHLVEIAGYRAPPSAVKLIMGAVMVVLGERSTQWADVVAVIRSSDFLSRVSTFDPSRITESQIRELKSTKYLKNPRFTREDAVKASYVLGNLYQWVMTQLEMVDVAARATDFEQLKKEREARMEENRQHLAQEKANFTQLEEEMKQLATEYQKAERKDKAPPRQRSLTRRTVPLPSLAPVRSPSPLLLTRRRQKKRQPPSLVARTYARCGTAQRRWIRHGMVRYSSPVCSVTSVPPLRWGARSSWSLGSSSG
ncbi:hypothetical protein AGDE_15147 [Angomonas deanei]|uniref:Microtubule-binding stalk of dynein motor, putative n=1 Tax=Angomonas deanei TaxID=59799 RepID=A0A7G2CPA6_9TRYP|nr:hypothetical protein AGDE_15147 [Angomonas deanei]CAD2220383.1 Microtubule-binding stalk of dynein motor, putative [Angomonas deanei]|eukprot:EPY19624.1 hypothetical protein AGDE_15147 [Angomonas deanei]